MECGRKPACAAPGGCLSVGPASPTQDAPVTLTNAGWAADSALAYDYGLVRAGRRWVGRGVVWGCNYVGGGWWVVGGQVFTNRREWVEGMEFLPLVQEKRLTGLASSLPHPAALPHPTPMQGHLVLCLPPGLLHLPRIHPPSRRRGGFRLRQGCAGPEVEER